MHIFGLLSRCKLENNISAKKLIRKIKKTLSIKKKSYIPNLTVAKKTFTSTFFLSSCPTSYLAK